MRAIDWRATSTPNSLLESFGATKMLILDLYKAKALQAAQARRRYHEDKMNAKSWEECPHCCIIAASIALSTLVLAVLAVIITPGHCRPLIFQFSVGIGTVAMVRIAIRLCASKATG